MIKTLKDFQEKAIKRILGYTQELLEDNKQGAIVLKSPTGSGKTFMMSQIISRLATGDDFKNEKFCFLWVTIGSGELHVQSYRSLKNTFKGFPDVYLIEQEFTGGRSNIDRNEVVVLNWEKLRNKDKKTGDWKNILMKDKETYNFIDVIEETKENGLKLVLIIDESHSSSTTERAAELKNDIIKPDITIEMSATPILSSCDHKHSVKPNDVINEGLIKKEIVINENIDLISDNETDSEKLVLECALNKQRELKELYQKEGVEINPLVLVQLPNGAEGDNKQSAVESFLVKHGISTDKGNLAIWLSDEKVHNEAVYLTPNQSNVDFLIFKQAVDTGWDCPRASILVRFRETKSITFEIQTVGRILRMPEAKHYNNDALNKGYVFTNLKSFDVAKEEYNPNIIKSCFSKRNEDIYSPIKLKSYYKHRISYNDITASFYEAFEEVFCEYFGVEKGGYEFFKDNKDKISEKIETNNLNNDDEIILNETIKTSIIDSLPHIEGNGYSVKLSENDKEAYFNKIFKNELGGFSPARSLGIMQNSFYKVFSKYMGIDLYGTGMIYLQSLALNNNEIISQLLNQAVEKYKPRKLKQDQKKASFKENWDNEWEIPQSKNYNPNTHEKIEYKLSLYTPCFLQNNRSKPEQAFEDFLESNKDKIKWWWKNGDEHMKENFGIKYNDQGSTFQPDYIVMFENEKIGLFDTKSAGFQEEDTKEKAEALQAYINDENSQGKNLVGGIIIEENNHLRINSKNNYNQFNKKPEDWDYLRESI